ncbi:actin-related protein 2-like [Camellia sinensis]|uniref:actin-related protein 2-like n=1 Tax=Camellia sinensis TaxID=4442 RepID=UPI0010359D3A|nr:actin-related protein 2-like [Camellia sinensis]
MAPIGMMHFKNSSVTTQRREIGLMAFALKLLLLKHFNNSTADFETVRDIKENLCYLSYDYKREYQLGLGITILVKNYTVPDGRVIKVGTERFQVPEALFTPISALFSSITYLQGLYVNFEFLHLWSDVNSTNGVYVNI